MHYPPTARLISGFVDSFTQQTSRRRRVEVELDDCRVQIECPDLLSFLQRSGFLEGTFANDPDFVSAFSTASRPATIFSESFDSVISSPPAANILPAERVTLRSYPARSRIRPSIVAFAAGFSSLAENDPNNRADVPESTGHIDGREEAWRSAAAQRFAKITAWEDCNDCSFIPVCAGGCSAAAHTELGDMNKPNCHKPSFEAGVVTLAHQAARQLAMA